MIEKILEMLETLYSMNEETKKTAYEEQDWEKFDLFMHRNEGVYFAKKIVQEVAKEYGNGWIPVETKLPKESVYDGYVEPSESVLVFTKYNECRVSRYWGNRRNKRDYYDWVDIKYRTDEVIAWQPLPAPYQKGE